MNPRKGAAASVTAPTMKAAARGRLYATAAMTAPASAGWVSAVRHGGQHSAVGHARAAQLSQAR